MYKRKGAAERFFRRVRVSSGCWEWTGAKNKKGYGTIGDGNYKTMLAHRMSWKVHYGDIPDELCVCHHCDNPSCVRPDHLFLGTQTDNMRDRKSKGNYDLHGEKNPFSRLDNKAVEDIRKNYQFRKTPLRIFAKKYNVSITAIHSVITRKNWSRV